MVGKRGRPAKSNTTININDLLVEFISKKENNYNAKICYFKVVDIDAKIIWSYYYAPHTPIWG